MKQKPSQFFSAFLALAALSLIAVLISMLVNPGGVPAAARSDGQGVLYSADPTEQAFLSEKAARLQGVLGMGTGGLEATKPADPCAVRPTPQPTPQQVSRLILMGGELDEMVNLRVVSIWQGSVQGQWVTLYSGLTNESEPVSAVYVQVAQTMDAMQYLPASNVGTLTIESVTGGRAKLVAADGSVLYFDIPGRTFVMTADEFVPALTPMPTLHPTPSICP